jgi:hypothetical protein
MGSLDEFRKVYPAFQLANELIVQGGEMSCGVSPMPGTGNRGPRHQGSRQVGATNPIKSQIRELIHDWFPS